MAEEFMFLDLALIEPSRTNPRKTFDAAKLQELATSIKAIGLHQPVVVRPLPASRVADTSIDTATGKPRKVRPTYELVCGERRYRASLLAGMDVIAALTRDLTDEEVMEIQIVENLQRDDLSELEEAEGYEQLMKHSGLNADQVGEKIGKSRSYVYARLKLLDLSLECKTAMRAGQIDASRALLIARIPDSKLQIKALEEAQRKDYQGEVPSVRALQTWLKQNVMLYLEGAIFKITDARLVEAAGSCKDCPKRTGANPDLFADVESADMCTDPVCFHGKEDAHRAQLRARAEKKGIRLIEGTEAKELMPNKWSGRINGYSKLDQVREDGRGEYCGQTLRALLGDKPEGVVLIENPYTKELIEAVPTEPTEAALIAKGVLRTEEEMDEDDDNEGGQVGESTGHLEQHIKRLTQQFEREQEKAQDKAVLEATVQAVRDTDDKAAKALIGPTFLRAYLLSQVGEVDEHSMAVALGYTFQNDEDEEQALVQYIKSCSHADLSRATVLVAMELEGWFSDARPVRTALANSVGVDTKAVRTALANSVGVDTKAVQTKAVKSLKTQYTAEVKALQARIDAANAAKEKAPPPNAPLAQPKNAGGDKSKGDKGSKVPAKNAPAARAKLSAEEALSGIATAMQGVDRAASAPDGAVAPPEATNANRQGGLAVGFVVGQRVRVTTIEDRLGSIARKWAGKEGTVTKTNVDHDPDFYDVTFKGRNGGLSTFRTDQIEAVGA